MQDCAWNSSRVDKMTFPSRNVTLVSDISLFCIKRQYQVIGDRQESPEQQIYQQFKVWLGQCC